jgi:hypothetical protein
MKNKNILNATQTTIIFGAISKANLNLLGSDIQKAVQTFGQTGRLPKGIKVPKDWGNTLQVMGINGKGGVKGGRNITDATGIPGVTAAFSTADGMGITGVIINKIKGITLSGDDLPTIGGQGPWDGNVNGKDIKNFLVGVVTMATDKCLNSHQLCSGAVQGQKKAYGKTFAMGMIACLAHDQGFTVTAFKTDKTGLDNDNTVYGKGRDIKRTAFNGFPITADVMNSLQNGVRAGDKIIAAITKGTPASVYCDKQNWTGIPVDTKVVDKINALPADTRKTVLREISVKITDAIQNHGGTTVGVTMKDLDTVITAVNAMGVGTGVNVRTNGQAAARN